MVDVWVCFWALDSIPLIHVSVFVPISCCFDYYNFVILSNVSFPLVFNPPHLPSLPGPDRYALNPRFSPQTLLAFLLADTGRILSPQIGSLLNMNGTVSVLFTGSEERSRSKFWWERVGEKTIRAQMPCWEVEVEWQSLWLPCCNQSCLCVGNSVWGKAAGALVNLDFIWRSDSHILPWGHSSLCPRTTPTSLEYACSWILKWLF